MSLDGDSRPMDALNMMKRKKVFVELKTGVQFEGILKAADLNINLWLSDVKIIGAENYQYEELFIRGDSVVLVNYVGEMR